MKLPLHVNRDGHTEDECWDGIGGCGCMVMLQGESPYPRLGIETITQMCWKGWVKLALS